MEPPPSAVRPPDVRHAAYESRIQDLLLLVEMNKKVAAEALKCSSATAQKLEDVTMYHHAQVAVWRGRMEASLRQRRQQRCKASVFATLVQHQRRYQQLRRLVALLHHHRMRQAWHRWSMLLQRPGIAVPSVQWPMQALFLRWRNHFRSRRRLRRLWTPILRRFYERRLAQALVRWRLQAKDEQLQIWIECLKGANVALEEQAKAYEDAFAETQAAHTREYAIEQRRYRRLDQTNEVCLTFRRWVGLCRLRHRRADLVAYRHRLQQQQLQRTVLAQWQRVHQRQRHATQLVRVVRQSRVRRLLNHCFRELRWSADQVRRLRRLCCRRYRNHSRLAWQRWQHSVHARGTYTALQESLVVVHADHRLALKRLQDARSILSSHMATLVHRFKAASVRQRSFMQWKRILLCRRQLRSLCVVYQRSVQLHLQLALARWHRHTTVARSTQRWLLRDRRAHGRRRVKRLWAAWVRHAQCGRRRKQRRFLAASVLYMWRQHTRTCQAQRVGAQHILHVLLRARCRHRFAQWRRQHAHQVRLRSFQRSQRRRHLFVLFRAWNRYAVCRRRLEKHTWRLWMQKRDARRDAKTKRRCFRLWHLRVEQQHRVSRHVELYQVQRYNHNAKYRVHMRWKQWFLRRRAIRRALQRVLRRLLTLKPLARALVQWKRHRCGLHAQHSLVRGTRSIAQRFWFKYLSDAQRTLLRLCFCGLRAYRWRAEYHGRLAAHAAARHGHWNTRRHFLRWHAFYSRGRHRRQWLRHWCASRRPRMAKWLALEHWRQCLWGDRVRRLERGAMQSQAKLATLLCAQQSHQHLRVVLQVWHRHMHRDRLGRDTLRRLLHRRYVVRLRLAWLGLLTIRPITNARAMDRWLGQRSARRARLAVLGTWRRKVVHRRRVQRLLLRLVVAIEERAARFAFVQWRRASHGFQIKYQRYVFTSYIYTRLARQARLRRLKLLFAHWATYHDAHTRARAKYEVRAITWRAQWQRRIVQTWNDRAGCWRRQRQMLRRLLSACTMRRTQAAWAHWLRTIHAARLVQSWQDGVDAARGVKTALADAKIHAWRTRLLQDHLWMWKAVTVTRRDRLVLAWREWHDVWQRRRLQYRATTLRTQSVRFHWWRRLVLGRGYVRKTLLQVARRWAQHRLRLGFNSWLHCLRRTIHTECLHRVMVIQAMLEATECENRREATLRPLLHHWRRSARAQKLGRKQVREQRQQLVRTLWRYWKCRARTRRIAMGKALRCRWQLSASVVAIWRGFAAKRVVARQRLRRLGALLSRKHLYRVWSSWQTFLRDADGRTAKLLLQAEIEKRRADDALRQSRILQYVHMACSAQGLQLLAKTVAAWKQAATTSKAHRRRAKRRRLHHCFLTWASTVAIQRHQWLQAAWRGWCFGVHAARIQRHLLVHVAARHLKRQSVALLRRIWSSWRDVLHAYERQVAVCCRRYERRLVARCMRHWRASTTAAGHHTMSALRLVFQQWKQYHRLTTQWAAKQVVAARHASILMHWRSLRSPATMLQTCLLAWRTDVFGPRERLHWRPDALEHAGATLVASVATWFDAYQTHCVLQRWRSHASARKEHRAQQLAHMTKRTHIQRLQAAWTSWKVHHGTWSTARRVAQLWRVGQAKRVLLRCFHAWTALASAQVAHHNALLGLTRWVRRTMQRRHLLLLCLHVWRASLPARMRTTDVGTTCDIPTPLPSTALTTLVTLVDRCATFQRRRAKAAFWNWYLVTHDHGSDTVAVDVDVGARLAHTLLLRSSSHVDRKKQRQWLMHFFTQQSHANLLRRSFEGFKRCHSIAVRSHRLDSQAQLVLVQCLQIIGQLHVRRRFHQWKSAYIALALAQAQEEHAVLMDALHDIAKYRHSLLP
ncbi:hypothetical protein SDRG_02092 [Saprolegnia diclina VS20]|uniref:Uncharacterized protein n=1 Tax=Saprolegnia diclina (strain VS20) TaxID=1156394 RepID=T0R3Y3_SAPDV|nr:hypothetical protein SDRG_02092 [Saprolegnia diclina VS20]EQC41035.1 hypothetical protein SDRG_02092 [Saprolegnia diclina VS20]|eukprot:XP_008605879.1 hypothetical protein SDRG_02092 [Saprolegnia diclina VS20]